MFELVDLLISAGVMLSLITLFLLHFRVKRLDFSFSRFSVKTFFLLIAINFLYFVFYKYNLLENFPHLFKIPGPIAFLIPVAFFYHVRYQIGKNIESNWAHVFHLTPFILASINYIPIFALSTDIKQELLIGISENRLLALQLDGLFLSETTIFILRSVLIVLYLILAIMLWEKEKYNLDLKRKVRKWIRLFIYSYVLLNALLIILLFISVLSPSILGEFTGQLIFLLSAGQFLTMSVYLVLNPDLLVVFSDNIKEKSLVSEYSNLEDIRRRIIKEEFFKNPDLSLASLSTQLDISQKDLSRIVNSDSTNFRSFLNEIRIQKAQELIEKGFLDEFTVESLAEEVGYSNRQTYYRAMKKFG